MSGANVEPLPFVRKFGGAGAGTISASASRSLTSYVSEQRKKEDDFLNAANVDHSGVAIVRPTVTGACRKCGFPGHHAHECYNSVVGRLRPESKPFVDVSSTSSEDSDDDSSEEEKKKKKKHKKHKKKEEKKSKKKKHKKEKKRKERKRRHSSSSDDDDSDSDDSTSKHRKKDRKKKEKKKRRRRSSSSSSS